METTSGSSKHINVDKEHLVLVQEPKNKYIGYVTPTTSNAEDTSQAIIDKLMELNVDLADLKILGGDGCALNTGFRAGVMRKIEEFLNRPLGRVICLLHFCEVLFKKIIEFFYGIHKGPVDFSHIEDDQLKTCHTLAVVSFKRISPRNFPKINTENMSQDQKYLFSMALAIKNGKVDQRLENYTPGPLNHARWLTLAARLLRFYVSQEKPSANLIAVVNFVMRVYIPHWQEVMVNSAVSFGSKHFFNLMQSTR